MRMNQWVGGLMLSAARVFLLGVLMLCAGEAWAAGSYFVRPDAVEGQTPDGTTWEKAYVGASGLQTALAIAWTNVYVMEGEYSTSTQCVTGEEATPGALFLILRGSKLYGGYSATSAGTDLSLRDPNLYPTRLKRPDGVSYDVVKINGTPIDNKNQTALDGVIVTQEGSVATGGCGIKLTGTYAQILDCTVQGIVSSASGAGIRVAGDNNEIRNCKILNNSTTGNGGGVLISNAGTHLINCMISGNIAQDANSDGARGGGGVWVSSTTGTVTIENCNINSNEAKSRGGALIKSGAGTLDLKACDIRNNKGNFNGAGIQLDAAAGTTNITNTIVANNYLSSNDRWGGGGINAASNLNLLNCTVVNNKSGDGSGEKGGGVRQYGDGAVMVKNSIIWGNIAGASEKNQVAGTIAFTNSAVEGRTADAENKNLNAANDDAAGPKFISPSASGYTSAWGQASWILKSGSVCIDAGADGAWTQLDTAKDIVGNPRKAGASIDIGVYETNYGVTLTPFENRIYLTEVGGGAMNGSSWADAAPSARFQDAMAAVAAGNEIWLGKGVYPITAKQTKAVKIFGGFSGETDKDSRAKVPGGKLWEYVNVSHIKGAIQDRLFEPSADGFELNGVSITNAPSTAYTGTGTVCEGGSRSDIKFINTRFIGTNGQPICLYGNNHRATISGCLFKDNTSNLNGNLQVASSGSRVTVTNCQFENNTATGNGGVIYVESSGGLSIDHTAFIGNTKKGGTGSWANGGGVFFLKTPGAVTVRNSFLINNVSEYVGGIATGNASAYIQFINCLIAGNKSTEGSLLYYEGGNANNTKFINCTIANNQNPGGLFDCPNAGNGFVRNTLMLGNQNNGVNRLTVENNSINSGALSDYCINAPAINNGRLPNWTSYDWRLKAGCAAIDAGVESDAPATDLNDAARPSHVATGYDIGAYEYQYPEVNSIVLNGGSTIEGVGVLEFTVSLSAPNTTGSYVNISLTYTGESLLTNPPDSIVIAPGEQSKIVSIPYIPNVDVSPVIVTIVPAALAKNVVASSGIVPISVTSNPMTVNPIEYTLSLDKAEYTEGDNLIVTVTRPNDVPAALIPKTIEVGVSVGSSSFASYPIRLNLAVGEATTSQTVAIQDLMGDQFGGTSGTSVTFSSPTTDPFISSIVSANAVLKDKDDTTRQLQISYALDKRAINKDGVITVTATLNRVLNCGEALTIPHTISADNGSFTVADLTFNNGQQTRTFTITASGETFLAPSYILVQGTPSQPWIEPPVSLESTSFLVGKNTVYVTLAGGGDNSGGDWLNALPITQIQPYLNSTYPIISKVCIAGGHYPLTSTLTVAAGKTLEGGYTVNDNTGSRTLVTSGELGDGSLVYPWEFASKTIFDNGGANREMISGGSAGMIDGIVFQNGTGRVSALTVNQTYKNCIIRNMTYSGDGGAFKWGGTFTLTAENCLFTNCTATENGGVFARNWDAAFDGAIVVKNCAFIGNKATAQGGVFGIRNFKVTASNSLFVNNESGGNGAVLRNDDNSTSRQRTYDFKNCTFANNKAGGSGIVSCGVASEGTGFSNCLIFGNISTGAFAVNITWTGTHNACDFDPPANKGINITGSDPFIKTSPFVGVPSTPAAWTELYASLFTLRQNGLSINSGDNALVDAGALDLANQPRIWNSAGQTNGVIDPGAYELQKPGDRLVVFENLSTVYTGAEQKIATAAYGLDDTRAPMVTPVVDYAPSSVIDVDTYRVTARDPSGHWTFTNSDNFVIQKASKLITGIPTVIPMRSGESYTFSPVVPDGEVVNMIAPDSDYTGSDPFTVSYNGAGMHNVTFESTETRNYHAAPSVTASLNVTAGDIAFIVTSPAVVLDVDNGDALPDISAGIGAVVKRNDASGETVSGTWTWETSLPITLTDKTHTAVFTPDASELSSVPYVYNFNIKTYSLTLVKASVFPVKSTFAKGESITVTPVLSGSEVFDYWTASGVTISDPTSISQILTMPSEAVTLTANVAEDVGIRYVSATGAGLKHGLSWRHASQGVGSVIQGYLNAEGVTQVRLAQGSYEISQSIRLAAGKELVGGWDTTTNTRDLNLRPTIRTSGINSSTNGAFTPQGASEADRNLFDGLIMQWVSGNAAVIYVTGDFCAYVTVKHVDFLGYQSTESAPINLGKGGLAENYPGFNVIFEDCLFSHTLGNWMGVVHVYRGSLSNHLRFDRCVIDGATTKPDGLICLRSNLIMNNCVIKNSLGDGNLFGGYNSAIIFTCKITNSTFLNNNSRPLLGPKNTGANDYNFPVFTNTVVAGSPIDLTRCSMNYSAWENSAATGTNLNISGLTPADLFDDDNGSLKHSSPLINRGTSTTEPLDFAGKARVWNPVGQGGGVTDIGAYEFQASASRLASYTIPAPVYFNGKEQPLVRADYAAEDNRLPRLDTPVVSYSSTPVMDAKTYTVSASDRSGHWILSNTADYTILPAPQSLAVSASAEKISVGGSVTFTVTAGESGNVVTPVVDPNTGVTVSGTTYTFANAGDYTVTFTQAAAANYAEAVVTIPVSVSAGTITQITPGDVKTAEYSGKKVVANFATVTDGGTDSTYQYRLQGTAAWQESAVFAGTYDVKVTVPGSDVFSGNTVTALANVVIQPAPLTITGMRVSSRVYESGNSSANISYWGDLDGVNGKDEVALVTTNATAVYNDDAVGEAKLVTVTGLSITGADASNYSFDGAATCFGDIVPAGTITLTASLPTATDSVTLTELAGKAHLSWPETAGINNFIIEYGTDMSFGRTLIANDVNEADVPNLLPYTPYYFRLSYDNVDGDAVYSNTVTLTPGYYAVAASFKYPAKPWDPGTRYMINAFTSGYGLGSGVIADDENLQGRDWTENGSVWMRNFSAQPARFDVVGNMANTFQFIVNDRLEPSAQNVKLNVWLDLDQNGMFDSSEMQTIRRDANAGAPNQELNMALTLPEALYGKEVMMRVRASADDQPNLDPYGFENTDAGMAWDMALFVKAPSDVGAFTVTLDAGEHGSFVDGNDAEITSVSVTPGNDVQIALKPDEGYSVENVTVDGVQAKITKTFTLKNIQGPRMVSATFTDFPTVFIDVDGGAEITSKEVYLKSKVIFEPNAAGFSSVEKTGVSIKGRGNSTWGYDKKPYRLKYSDKVDLFGMGKAKNWVLLANYIDPSGLRNDVAFEMGRRLGVPFTHQTQHVRMIFNGRFDGLYQLTEQSEVGSTRVDINEDTDWLCEFDTYADEYMRRTAKLNLPTKFKNPEMDGTSPTPEELPKFNAVMDQINAFETALLGSNTARPDEGYEKYINEDTFIDWLLVHMIAGNYEPKHPKSTYFHTNTKNGNGKITAGVLWDFDWAYGYGGYEGNFDTLKNCMWFGKLFTYPKFAQKFKTRWAQVKPILEEGTTIYNYIDTKAGQITAQQTADYSRWAKSASHSSEVSGLKNWMQNNISTIQTAVDALAPLSYSITADPMMTNGSVNIPSLGVVGDSIIVTAIPAQGYTFGTVSFNSTEILPVNGIYEFMMPAEPVTVSATFTALPSTTIIVVGGTASPAYAFPNETVTVTASALVNQKFNNWTVDPSSVVLANPYAENTTFTMGDENVTLTAHFVQDTNERYFVAGVTGQGSQKGYDWANAAPASKFIEMLKTPGNIATFNLAAGDYELSETLVIPSGIKVLGGYDGSGTRDPAVNVTVLKRTGDVPFRVVNMTAGTTGTQTLLDGVTVSGGSLTDGGNGAGILANDQCEIKNCNVTDCHTVRNGTGMGPSGGGIYTTGAVTVENCVISNNSASVTNGGWAAQQAAGGGIYASGVLQMVNTKFLNCSVTVNSNADGEAGTKSAHGGGLYLGGAGSQIEGCIFSGNTVTVNSTTSGGAAIVKRAEGAGIYIVGNQCQLLNSTLFNCRAALNGTDGSNVTRSVSGGGVYDQSTGLVMTSVVFWQNSALTDSQYRLGTTPAVSYCAVQGTDDQAGESVPETEKSFYLHTSNSHAAGPRFKKADGTIAESVEEVSNELIPAPGSLLINRGMPTP